jgi:signal peptidase I
MANSRDEDRTWKVKNRPYIYAVVLALVLTMFVAPEIQEGDSMSPTIDDGSVLVIIKEHYSQKRGIPEIGTVVILEKTAAKGLSDDNLIARVVGLPGETVAIKDGKLYRDGKAYEVAGARGSLGEDMETVLGDEEVFLLSDNRDEKLDSRSAELGPVDMESIRGNVRLVIWPFSKFGGIE